MSGPILTFCHGQKRGPKLGILRDFKGEEDDSIAGVNEAVGVATMDIEDDEITIL